MGTEPDKQAFGVYVHWPFCAAKCPYCDFNSHVRHQPVDQNTFVEAYGRELSHMAAIAPGRTVTSIFFGGGTPSLMEPATVGRILDQIARVWHVDPNCEISMEANPSSVEAERFRSYREAGVNRVSLGVQSLDDAQLRFLGRLHSASEAITAIELARKTFNRISFDMIYARPGQHVSHWEQELRQVLDLAADHLSLYQLTIEPQTPFYQLHTRGKLVIPDEELAAELYETTQAMTREAGLAAYEISNHAAAGSECRHNLVYWRGQDYAGVGPGAHGRLSTNEGRLATATLRNPEDWWQKAMVEGHGIDEQFVLSRQEQADERLLMGLRLAEGFAPGGYNDLSEFPITEDKVAFLQSIELLETLENGHIRATPKGFLLLDAVVADLASPLEKLSPGQ
jgi:oxygen-independent coproporphyrinogen-3 oxidase